MRLSTVVTIPDVEEAHRIFNVRKITKVGFYNECNKIWLKHWLQGWTRC